jgi:3'(2'), 5'-bisphosphate nucleotidase
MRLHPLMHWDVACAQLYEYYWLVDPMDGTKEFLKRNGEFTVNIALMYKDHPVMGVVHVPVTGKTYW